MKCLCQTRSSTPRKGHGAGWTVPKQVRGKLFLIAAFSPKKTVGNCCTEDSKQWHCQTIIHRREHENIFIFADIYFHFSFF